MTSLVLGLVALSFVAQPAVAPDKAARIDAAISAKMIELGVPGITAAIAAGGEVRWTNAYGLADVENNVPMKTSSVLRLGSIAKPITAVAVMQQVEAGKIALDGDIRTYVPSFTEKQWPVKVRHLLSHQGGVRHYAGEELQITRHYKSVGEGLAIFERDALLFEPGSKYSYTTYGFNLLGAAVEAATGKAFLDYVRERIAGPAGAVTLEADDQAKIILGRSRGYRLTENKVLYNCGLADTSYKIPGGGMISRAEDLVKFGIAMMGTRLLRRDTVEQMFQPQAFNDGKMSDYGLGWRVDAFAGHRRIWHSGGQQGITTNLVLFPNDGVAIAVMANLEGTKIAEFTDAVAKIVFEK
ncbi:serine hydrolase [Bryobacterales bacterium F-183]|nr:serine hydrolase [Bryobacterales bacterium F-183]